MHEGSPCANNRPATRSCLMAAAFAAVLGTAAPLWSADFANPAARQEGNQVLLEYDLVGSSRENQRVTVYIEFGGRRYAATDLHITGNFGENLKFGGRNRVSWDLLRDLPSGLKGEVTWELGLSAGPSFIPPPSL
ncbi:hypothetical protein L4X63_03050 [Geomonas sp. Red32]|uniref:hypothetical protein n=1 Tax=Geomonas sp. Red32 TaxID=2912856 RepID=UPI00202CF000|nr:hypothetical protein [Geomonas sp. Red32]MCM0080560.1 hypothetical protein [Geomonas sp. Red32]